MTEEEPAPIEATHMHSPSTEKDELTTALA
jgi:hypothetical protein